MARNVKVTIVGDASSLERAFSRAGKAGAGFSSGLGRVAKTAALVAGAAGIGGLVATLKIGWDEMEQGQKVAAQTGAVLKSTGAAANVTAKEVSGLATALMEKSGVDDEVIASGENMLLTFTNIHNEAGRGNDIFTQSTKTLLDMSTALGTDMNKSAIQLGKALNDPIKGLTALTRVGVTFDAGQKKQIKSMAEAGNVMGAQKIILKELQKEFGGSAEAAGKTFPGQLSILKESFKNMAGEVVTNAIPSIKKILPVIGAILTAAVRAVGGTIGWFTKLGKELGKEHTFRGKLRVIWTNVKETAQDLASRLADFFWRGWSENVEGGGETRRGSVAMTKFRAGLLAGLKDVDWGALGGEIWDGIVAGMKNVGEVAQRVSDIFSEAMDKIDWEQVGRKLGPALASMITVAFTTLTDPSFWIRNWDLGLAVAIVAFGGSLGRLAGKIAAPFAAFIAREFGSVALRLAELAERLFGSRFGGMILNALMKAGEYVAQGARFIVAKIVQGLGAIEGLVRGVFGKLGRLAVFVVKVLGVQAAIDAVARLAKEVAGKIRDAFNSAVEFSGSLPGKIKNALASAWGTLSGWLRTAAGDLAIAFLYPLSRLPWKIGDPFTQAIKKIRAWMDGDGSSQTKGGGDSLMKAAAKGIEGATAGMANSMRVAGGKAVGALAKQAGPAHAAGVTTGSAGGQGLADGLNSMIGPVQAAAAALSRAAHVSMSTELQTQSPSKVTFLIGKQTGQGFADGITSTIGGISTAVTGLVNSTMQSLKAQLAARRGEVASAFNDLMSSAISAADALGPAFGSKATRALGKKLTAEQQAQKDAQDAADKKARDAALKAAKTAQEQLTRGEGETDADWQARVDAAKKAVDDATKAIADAEEQARIDADAKALAEAQKRDKDAFEKQLAALEKQAGGAKTKAQLAKIKKKIRDLFSSYGITEDSLQSATDWQTAQSLFVGAIGGLMKSLDALTAALGKIGPGGLSKKQYGGYLPGSGGIPIMAHGGEYVIRKNAVDKLGVDFLNSLNRYDEGGFVGDSDYAKALRDRHGKWENPRNWAPDEMRTGSVLRGQLEGRFGDRIHFEDAWVQALYHANAGQLQTLAMSPPPFSLSDATWGQAWYDFPGGKWKVPSFASGGVMQRDGLAYLHRGETVTPGGGPLVVHVHVGDEEVAAIVQSNIVNRGRKGGPLQART